MAAALLRDRTYLFLCQCGGYVLMLPRGLDLLLRCCPTPGSPIALARIAGDLEARPARAYVHFFHISAGVLAWRARISK